MIVLSAAEIAEVMEPYLRVGNQEVSGAEISTGVSAELWAKHLRDFPIPSDLVIRSDHSMTRSDLVEIAEVARREGTGQARMNFFWNVMAWGLAGSWRNVGRLVAYVSANLSTVVPLLNDASAAAYTGDPRAAFSMLRRRVDRWGPAFFTKYLHFSADFGDSTKVQPLILDSRVHVAWRAFSGRWLDPTSAADYEDYCQKVYEIALTRGSEPGWVEGRLYQFARAIGTYEKLLEKRLELFAALLPPEDTPTIADAWQELAGGEHERDQAAAAVAAHVGGQAGDYEASRAPAGSIHHGVWYVSEADGNVMIDNCVWMVLPSGKVTRDIPVGNPIVDASPLDVLESEGDDDDK